VLEVGMKCVLEKRVEEFEAASSIGSGGLEVFSTPHLIAFMERAAYTCVQSELPLGDTTVGIEVNIKHLKATAIGKNIKSVAELVKIDGKKLDFIVTVYEGEEKIGEGSHSRFIVNGEKFMSKLMK